MAGGEPIDVVQPHAHAKVLGVTANAVAADAEAAVAAARAAARCGARCRTTTGPPSC